jgi:hypothetical protein
LSPRRIFDRSWLKRKLSATRGRVEVIGLTLVIMLCAAVGLTTVSAVAADEKLEGTPVPEADVPVLVSAAVSCPTLTPPKLAAQLMAISGFKDDGPNGNLAGMDAETWKKWRPTSGAIASDRNAAITALAHQTCETTGQLRLAGLTGDLWEAAVAAQQAGVAAVTKAKGVPEAQREFVDKVAAYSRWYADQKEFSVNGVEEAPESAAPSSEKPVPAELVSYVRSAGEICTSVTPARIAAQLRVLSGFDASKRSGDGRQGIAQFTPALWESYSSRTTASPWDPEEAIPAMGVAMCTMSGELSGLSSGGDPYTLALGAYQWGPKVIRQAGGLPRTTVPQLADEVNGYVTEYQNDTRLYPGATPATSSPAPSASATAPAPKVTVTETAPAAPEATAPAKKTPAPAKTTAKPKPKPTVKQLFTNGKVYRLENAWAKSAVELPGDQGTKPAGTKVQLWGYFGGNDQKWRAEKAGSNVVRFVNVHYGFALSVDGKSKANEAKLVMAKKDTSNKFQQWKLLDAGNGQVFIRNMGSGKVMDLLGDDLNAPFADGTWNGYKVEQWDLQDGKDGGKVAKDQRWVLMNP